MTRRRLIIDTDAKNEADDQFAIVHALLSRTLHVEGLIAAHFGTDRTDRSMEESRAEIDLLLDLLGMADDVAVANGAPKALPDETTPIDSGGARMIIDAARKPGPLFVAFLGPLTDMASALLLDPELAERDGLVVVWVGGEPYDTGNGGPYAGLHGERGEFNLGNDVAAANVVLSSGVEVWQIPWTVYSMVSVGETELDQRMALRGPLGAYLVDQTKAVNAACEPPIEYRSLGDSPAVGVVMNPLSARWRFHQVRRFAPDGTMTSRVVPNRTVRVAEAYDVRWLIEDLFAKVEAFAGRSEVN